MRLIERNFRCHTGEIDLIMEEPGSLVFVEVRFRTAETFGSALERVDQRKKARMTRCATQYRASRELGQAMRFDVVASLQSTDN